MAKLKNYNGRFCESEFENAFISFLGNEGWSYLAGDKIVRPNQKEVLIADDLKQFLEETNPDLEPDEVQQIADSMCA
jgi:type I restriction enzyme R subunit